MTVEESQLKQSEISDGELINLCDNEVEEPATTYGKSHRMTIPSLVTDTDMLLSELIERFRMLSEAMRWRDPKDESPGKKLPVIIKYELMDGKKKYYAIEKYSYGRFKFDIEKIGGKVIGWRPIE